MPKGTSRLRITLSSQHTEAQILDLINALKEVLANGNKANPSSIEKSRVKRQFNSAAGTYEADFLQQEVSTRLFDRCKIFWSHQD